MEIVAMLRIRNEARWIEPVVSALLPLCERVFILDDHSTDGTPEICRGISSDVDVYESPFEGLDEARDKNWLYDILIGHDPRWILAIDGDELLAPDGAEAIRETIASGTAHSYSLQVLYLWDRDDQVRVDGVYARFHRPSLFRLINPGFRFQSTPFGKGANFHCSNVPQELLHGFAHCSAKLYHFGYLEATDRKRKFDWYNQIDPHNEAEDRYRHVIQGDPGGPPASARLRHAGPLKLERIAAPVPRRPIQESEVRK